MINRVRVSAVVLLVAAALAVTLGGFAQQGYQAIATDEFYSVWERNDYPVQELMVARTWTWGPGASSPLLPEPYFEAPGGVRDVQYFDKSRMEMPWITGGDPSSPWFITQGLLARELMTGQLQLGDNLFEQHQPSQQPAAGDPDDENGPTYATMGQAMSFASRENGTPIVQVIARDGSVTENAELSVHEVYDAYFVPETGFNVASVFWEFMNSQGLIAQNGEFVEGPIFEDPFYAVGLPLTNAYYAWVKVADVYQYVLIQCFERRCLTFTPDNPAGWEVESGNIGMHYYKWRYQEIDRTSAGTSFTVTPVESTNTVGDTHQLTVTVFDYDGTPKNGVPVTALVTTTSGAGQQHLDIAMSGISGDSGDGVSVLSYTGVETGTDTIVVSVNGVVEIQTVSKTWVAASSDDPAPPPSDDDGDADDGEDPPFMQPDPDSITLAPAGPATGPVGNEHTVTATVVGANNTQMLNGTAIFFTIAGPNSNQTGTASLSSGVATFTYTGTVSGVDTITAHRGSTTSNAVSKEWLPGPPTDFTLQHLGIDNNPPLPENVIYLEPHTLVGTVVDEFNNRVPGVPIDFSIDGPNSEVNGLASPAGDSAHQAISDSDGQVTFTWAGTEPGIDTVHGEVSGTEEVDLRDSVQKIWLDLRALLEHVGEADNHTGLSHTVRATVEYQEHETDNWVSFSNGALVEFEIDGANSTASGETDPAANGAHFGLSNDSGEVTFTWTGSSHGPDEVTATIMSSAQEATPIHASVTKNWFTWAITLADAPDTPEIMNVGDEYTVFATVVDHDGNEVDGVEVEFTIIDGPHAGDFSHTGDTGDHASGQVAFSYTGALFGSDTIRAEIVDERAGDQGDSDTTVKQWLLTGVAVSPADAQNPYFTTQEINAIETLIVSRLNDPTEQEIEDAIAAFWLDHTGHTSPNLHTVVIQVTEDGQPVSGEDVLVTVVFDVEGDNEEHQNQTLALVDGQVEFTYPAWDAGVDTITAQFGVTTETATKTWTPYRDFDYPQIPTYLLLEVDPATQTVLGAVNLYGDVLDQFGEPYRGQDVSVRFESDRVGGLDTTVEVDNDIGEAVVSDYGSTGAGEETITATLVDDGTEIDSATESISWQDVRVSLIHGDTSDATSTNLRGDEHTVTATVEVETAPGNWAPMNNVVVEFEVTGTHPVTVERTTGSENDGTAAGQADFTWMGSDVGTDTISVSIVNSSIVAGPITKHWTLQVTLAQESSENLVLESHSVVATVADHNGPVAGVPVDLGHVNDSVNAGATVIAFDPEDSEPATVSNADGQIGFRYSYAPENYDSSDPGQDYLQATATLSDLDFESNTLTKTWLPVGLTLAHGDGQPDVNEVHDSHTIVATLVDGGSSAITSLPGTPVRFEFSIDSVNHGSTGSTVPDLADATNTGQTNGDSDGQVTFTWSGANFGVDSVTAVVALPGWETVIVSAPIDKTWKQYQFSFDPTDATNPYFTSEQIEEIEALVVSTLPDPNDDEARDAAIAAFWTEHTGHASPNRHTVQISVLVDGVAIEDGETVNVTVVFTPGDVTVIDDQGYTSADGKIVVTYSAEGVGSDDIQVSYELGSDSTSKTWVPYLDSGYTQVPTYLVLTHDEAPDQETAINTVADTHHVTATVLDQFGQVVEDFSGDVDLLVEQSVVDTQPVDQGTASLSYVGPTQTGSDSLSAQIMDNDTVLLSSNTLTKVWEADEPTTVEISANPTTQTAGGTIVLSAAVRDVHGNLVPNVDVKFYRGDPVDPLEESDEIGSGTTGANGEDATFDYTQTQSGEEELFAVEQENASRSAGEDVTWVAGDAHTLTVVHEESGTSEPTQENKIYLEPHTVLVTVVDEHDNRVPDVTVAFQISGANAGAVGQVSPAGTEPNEGVTNDQGQVTFTWTGTAPETDTVTATVKDSTEPDLTDSVDKFWQDVQIEIDHAENHSAENLTGTIHAVEVTVSYRDSQNDWHLLEDVPVTITVTGANPSTPLFSGMLASGTTTQQYTGVNPGLDTITATIDDTPLSANVTKLWTLDVTLSHVGQPVNPLGTGHEVEVLVEDDNGPRDGVTVEFEIISGPNQGEEDDSTTADGGKASFSWIDENATNNQVDTVQARAMVGSVVVGSTTIEKTWQERAADRFEVLPANEENLAGTLHEITVTVYDQFDDLFDGASVTAQVTDAPENAHTDRVLTDANSDTPVITTNGGVAVLGYTGDQNVTGGDVIEVTVAGVSESQFVNKTWIIGEATNVSLVHADHQGETIPENATWLEPHTVIATVTDSAGNFVVSADVEFSIEGENETPAMAWVHDPAVEPDTGQAATFSGTTSSTGQIAFTYTGTIAGEDEITASLLVDEDVVDDDEVQKRWLNTRLVLSHNDTSDSTSTNLRGATHTVTAQLQVETETDIWVNLELDDVPVDFDISGPNDEESDTVDTAGGGLATFSYIGSEFGTDQINASIDGTPIAGGPITKIWAVQVSLNQTEDENLVLEEHSLVATVTDHHGPALGIPVTLEFLTDSVNAGVTVITFDPADSEPASATNSDGQIGFRYSYDPENYDPNAVDFPGSDELRATATAGALQFHSDSVTKTWLEVKLTLDHADGHPATNTAGDVHTVVASLVDGDDEPVALSGVSIDFNFLAGSVNTTASSFWVHDPAVNHEDGTAGTMTGSTNASGQIAFSWIGTSAGDDTLEASVGNGWTDEISDQVTKTWVAGPVYQIVLSHTSDFETPDQSTAHNPVATSHTVYAQAMDQFGNPVAGETLTFTVHEPGDPDNIYAGPTEAATTTDAQGVTSFSYAGPTAPRLDAIVASGGISVTSGPIQKQWVPGDPATIIISHEEGEFDPPVQSKVENDVETEHTVWLLVRDSEGNPVADGTVITVTVTDNATSNQITSGQPTTTGGVASFTYSGPASPRLDDIQATWNAVSSATIQKEWVSAAPEIAEVAGQTRVFMTGQSSVTLTVPTQSTRNVGDLLVVVLSHDEGSAINRLRVVSSSPECTAADQTCNGWTVQHWTNRSSDLGQIILYRVVDGTEQSSYQFFFRDGSSSKSVKGSAVMLHITGTDPVAPIAASSGGTGDSSTMTAPQVSAPTGATLMAFFLQGKEDATLTLPSGSPMSIISPPYPFTDGDEISAIGARELWLGSGNTNTRSANSNEGENWIAQMIALNPAP